MGSSLKDLDILKKISLAMAVLTIFLILISVVFTIDKIVTDQNYSRNSYFDFVTDDENIILCWVDYLEGNGRIWISKFDADGHRIVEPMMISSEQKDSFTPKLALRDDILFVSWLEAKEDPKDSRIREEVDVILNIGSYDASSMEPVLPYGEATELCEFSTEQYWIQLRNWGDSLSIQARISGDNSYRALENANIDHFRITSTEITSISENEPKDPQFLIIELSEDGAAYDLIDSQCDRVLLPKGRIDGTDQPLTRRYLFQFDEEDVTTIISIQDIGGRTIEHSWAFVNDHIDTFGNARSSDEMIMFQGVWEGEDIQEPCFMSLSFISSDVEIERSNITGYKSFFPLSWSYSGDGVRSLWMVYGEDDDFNEDERILSFNTSFSGDSESSLLDWSFSDTRARSQTDEHILISLKRSDGECFHLHRYEDRWSERSDLMTGKGLDDISFSIIMFYVIATYVLIFIVLIYILDRNKKRTALRKATQGSMVEMDFTIIRKCIPGKYRHLDDRALFDVILEKYQPPAKDPQRRREAQSFFMMKFVYIGAVIVLVFRIMNLLFWYRFGTSTFPLYMVGYTPYIELPILSVLITYSIWNLSDIGRKGALQKIAILILFGALALGAVQSLFTTYVAFIGDMSVNNIYSLVTVTGPLMILATLFAPFMVYAECDDNPRYLTISALMVFAFTGAIVSTVLFNINYTFQTTPYSMVIDNWLTSMISLMILGPLMMIGSLLMGTDIDIKEITKDKRYARDLLKRLSTMMVAVSATSIMVGALIGLVLMWDLKFFFHWAMVLIFIALVGLSIMLHRLQMNENLASRISVEPMGNIVRSYLTPLIFVVCGFVAGIFTGPVGIILFTMISVILLVRVHLQILPIIDNMSYDEVMVDRPERRTRGRRDAGRSARTTGDGQKAAHYRRMFSEELPDEIFMIKIHKEYRDVLITMPVVGVIIIPFYLLIDLATDIHQYEPIVMWGITILLVVSFTLLALRGSKRNFEDINRIDYPAGLVRCLTEQPKAEYTSALLAISIFCVPNFWFFLAIIISAIIFEMFIYTKNRDLILDRFSTFKPYQKRVTPIQMAGMKTTNWKFFMGPLLDRFLR